MQERSKMFFKIFNITICFFAALSAKAEAVSFDEARVKQVLSSARVTLFRMETDGYLKHKFSENYLVRNVSELIPTYSFDKCKGDDLYNKYVGKATYTSFYKNVITVNDLFEGDYTDKLSIRTKNIDLIRVFNNPLILLVVEEDVAVKLIKNSQEDADWDRLLVALNTNLSNYDKEIRKLVSPCHKK